MEYLPLEDVAHAPANPKRHDIAAIRASIDRFGLAAPALRDERTGRLVVGHGRLTALADMRQAGETPPEGVTVDPDGRWLVPVVCGWSSRSDAEAAAYLAADNQLTILGGWDPTGLAALLDDIAATDPDLAELTGVDRDALADLIRANEPPGLDELAADVGDPAPDDSWPIIRLKVPPHVAAAWRTHRETHDDDTTALAALLDVDPDTPAPSRWEP